MMMRADAATIEQLIKAHLDGHFFKWQPVKGAFYAAKVRKDFIPNYARMIHEIATCVTTYQAIDISNPTAGGNPKGDGGHPTDETEDGALVGGRFMCSLKSSEPADHFKGNA